MKCTRKKNVTKSLKNIPLRKEPLIKLFAVDSLQSAKSGAGF